MDSFPIFLLDMDGVLIEPHGYRLSLQATLAYFTGRMGLGDLYPGEETIALLESINMTSEWDSTPIILAAVIDALLGENPGLVLPGDLLQACETVRYAGVQPPRLDFIRLADLLKPHFSPGSVFADLALRLNQPGSPFLPFPHLAGHPLAVSLLGRTRDLEGSLVTRVFQHFAVGSAGFEAAFGQPSLFAVGSYLQAYDRPLLLPGPRDRLLADWRAEKLGAAGYTARPSALVGVSDHSLLAYSPEAELVLDLVGLREIPLVGIGQVCWLAGQVGCSPDQFVKPSPVQALAAIGAAATRQVIPAVLAAERLASSGEAGFYRGFPALTINIFEDSAGSIRAVREAAGLLAGAGIPTRVRAWGIARSPVKRAALEQAGAELCEDINQALARALQENP